MRLLFTFYFGVIVFNTSAQNPSFTWNPAHTKPSPAVDVKLMGYSNGGYFIVNKTAPSGTQFNPGINIEYVLDTDRKFSKDIPFTQMDDLVDVAYFNGSLYIFNALYNKDEGKNNLVAKQVGTDGTVGQAVVAGIIPAEKLSKRGLFKIAVSPDGTKLAVLSQPEYIKDENEKINVTVYTNGFEEKISKDHTFSLPWAKAVNNIPYINNAGTVFIVKQTDLKDDKYSVFTQNGNSLNEYKIELDGKKKIYSMAHAFSPSGDFITAGYYTEDGKVNVRMGVALKGSVLSKISGDGSKSIFSTVNPFEKRKDVIAKYILFHNDKIILAGEDYTVTERAPDRDPSKPVSSAEMFARDKHFSANDIYIDAFDATAQPAYTAKLNKSHSSKNDNGTWITFFAAMIKNQLHLFINDEKTSYDDKKRAVVFGSNKVIIHFTMDPVNGTISKGKILETEPVGGKSGDMLLRPDVFLKVDESNYLIRAENPRIYRMGRISF